MLSSNADGEQVGGVTIAVHSPGETHRMQTSAQRGRKLEMHRHALEALEMSLGKATTMRTQDTHE
jgi:hypothetical protein